MKQRFEINQVRAELDRRSGGEVGTLDRCKLYRGLVPQPRGLRALFRGPESCRLNRTFSFAAGKTAKNEEKAHSGELAIVPAPKLQALLGG